MLKCKFCHTGDVGFNLEQLQQLKNLRSIKMSIAT